MKKLILFTVCLAAIPSLTSCALLQGRQGRYDEGNYQQRVASAIIRQDLILGMQSHDVQDAWGSPQNVERAGYSESAAERWIYVHGLSHASGFRDMAEKRIVYFQNGRVVGWETER